MSLEFHEIAPEDVPAKRRGGAYVNMLEAFLQANFKIAELSGFEDAQRTYICIRTAIRRSPRYQNVGATLRGDRVFIYRKDKVK